MTTKIDKVWRHAKELQQAAELLAHCCKNHQEWDYLKFQFESVTSEYRRLKELFTGDSL